ncbi:MAG: carboxypeptidase-like regulatory domain-containing protein [Planctomycetota bacterium]
MAGSPTRKRGIAVKKGELETGLELKLGAGLTLTGIVRDAQGKPVAGAQVSLGAVVMNLDEAGGGGSRGQKVETGADGRFEITGIRDSQYYLRVSKTGYLPIHKEALHPDGTALDLVLQRSGAVFGRVRDGAAKAPVTDFTVGVDREGFGPFPRGGNARVLLGKEAADFLGVEAQPDLFVITDLPATSVSLHATAAGFADATLGPIEVNPEQRVEVSFDLVPEISVAGVVHDPDGKPVAGAQVSVQPRGDDDEVTDLGPGRKFVPRARRVVRGSPASPPEVIPANRPKTGTTGEDGRFTVTGLGPGDVTVTAAHRDFAVSEPQEVRLEQGRHAADLDLRLQAAGVLAGRAVDADGQPLGGGRVNLTPEHAASEDRPHFSFGGSGSNLTATTDVEGKFEMRGLAPGRYYAEVKEPLKPTGGAMLMVELPGQEGEVNGVRVEIAAGQTTQVELALTPKAQVSGVVTESGRPAAGVAVSIARDGGFSPFGGPSAKTASDGQFTLRDLEPGDYTVQVSPSGAAMPVERKISLHPREEARCDIALPIGTIAGQVVDETSGQPIAGVQVSAAAASSRDDGQPRQVRGGDVHMVFTSAVSTSSDGDPPGVARFSFGGGTRTGPVTTDQNGRYELRYLEEGDYDVSIQGKGVTHATKSKVKVAANQRTENIDFKAARGATLLVKPDHGGHDAMFCVVHLAPVDNENEQSTQVTHGDEPARFDGLKPGRYRVKANADDRAGETTVEIGSGEEKTVTVRLREQA